MDIDNNPQLPLGESEGLAGQLPPQLPAPQPPAPQSQPAGQAPLRTSGASGASDASGESDAMWRPGPTPSTGPQNSREEQSPDTYALKASLSEAHRNMLERASRIAPEVILERGYDTCSSVRRLKELGFSAAQASVIPEGPVLLIPTYGVTGELNGVRMRPDCPRRNKDGKPVKYEQPARTALRLDVPRRCLPKLLDPSAPLWVTEGEKKADALASSGRCAVALFGVTAWHTPAVKADLMHFICWKQREVICAFDGDFRTNPDVLREMCGFAAFAARLGAKARFLVLPELEKGVKTGVDDYLADPRSLPQLEDLVTDRLPEGSAPAAFFDAAGLADTVLQFRHFARDEADRLYVYEAGRYLAGGEKVLAAEVYNLMERAHAADKWNPRKAADAAEALRAQPRRVPLLWPCPPLNAINVLNGMLDLRELIAGTGPANLQEHSPAWLSMVQLPVYYDPAADCKFWKEALRDICPDDAPDLPFELAAWIMTPDTAAQKAVLLIGPGSNGKSTLLSALAAFIGENNCAAISLQALADDRFAPAGLVGKLLNVCADLDGAALASTSTFKALTGGDEISVERKYCDRFSYRNYARLLFSANGYPTSKDKSDGFFRRWLVVPFTKVFGTGEGVYEQANRMRLDARLRARGELSGALNEALRLLPGVRQNGPTQSAKMLAAHTAFRTETDPVRSWLREHVADDPLDSAPRAALYAAYRAECEQRDSRPVSAISFGRAVRKAFPDVGVMKVRIGSATTWTWEGIRSKDGAEESADGGPDGDALLLNLGNDSPDGG